MHEQEHHNRMASMAHHPAGSRRSVGLARPAGDPENAAADAGSHGPAGSYEDGSLVTEYGLLAVVAATIAGVVISWASNGALVSLFNALLRQARTLVGA